MQPSGLHSPSKATATAGGACPFLTPVHPAGSSSVRMAEWSKAPRSGRGPLLRAWVRIPLLTEAHFCRGQRTWGLYVVPRFPVVSLAVGSKDCIIFSAPAPSGRLEQVIGSIADGRDSSRVAQWKRAGPITQRSVDRNYALLAHNPFSLAMSDLGEGKSRDTCSWASFKFVIPLLVSFLGNKSLP